MRVKNISYENLNGLTNCFEFSEKLNVFLGSNGVGKTTSLDCLSILLCGESFSYGKTLEKHIDVKNRENVCTLNMIVETDEKLEGKPYRPAQVYKFNENWEYEF